MNRRWLWAFLRRDARLYASYRWGWALGVLGILSSVTSFFFISRLVGERAPLNPYGGEYFGFVLIGIAFARFQGLGLSAFMEKIRSEQVGGTLEAVLAAPVSLPAVLIGSTLWEMVIATGEVVLYLVIGGLVFGLKLQAGGILWAAVTFALGYLAFLSLGLLAGAFVLVFKRGNPVAWAFGEVSELLGGVYFPLTLLPSGLQAVSRWLPITHTLEGLRRALLTGAGPAQLWPQWLALAGFAAVLGSLGIVAFRYAIARARREGTLSHS